MGIRRRLRRRAGKDVSQDTYSLHILYVMYVIYTFFTRENTFNVLVGLARHHHHQSDVVYSIPCFI